MKRYTVLVVDDQVINRRILGKILSETYEVLYACDGEECMEILKENAVKISAVLLDIVMPKMDGYEVLAELKDNLVLSKIPVIVSSKIEGDEAEIKALSLGAQDFISKPYKADIIRHRLANTIKLRETAALINEVERDELTGLYNKQFFAKKVKDILEENPEKRYDLICLDIERFKLINDTFGILKGDEILRYVAGVIQDICGEFAVCGHFDADVFYIVLPHIEEYTNEMFQGWSDKFNEFPIQIPIKVRYGIYRIHDIKLPVSAMCDRAQLATEEIKGQFDRLFAFYDDKIRQKLLDERFITDTMQQALEAGEFHVYYQPKYELTRETIAGAEALVRWVNPVKGFMSPGEFIPLFEKNGFITRLDHYVWEQTCMDIRERMDKGLTLVAVSVNVSRADLYSSDLLEVLTGLISKYQIPIRYLHLEITESAYTENPEQILEVVKELRNLGFIIEMDDFGSGYSSLNMLAEIPIDILKLDMRFIKNESENASGKGILSFVISLAKWLDLAVVAEGVETQEQITSLRNMDCNYVQGYYFAKPMTKEDFMSLLQKSEVSEMYCTSSPEAGQRSKKPTAQLNRDKRVMLIVDDIELNRARLGAAFEDQYAIVEKENGKLAWEYLQKEFEKVDIVMLDLLMPVMDGFQTLDRIRSDERTKKIPVIITSQGDYESEFRALEMDADDFVSKPYNIEIVRRRVRNVMANFHQQQLESEKNLVEKIAKLEQCAATLAQTSNWETVQRELERLRKYFDLVRLVDSENTTVCGAVCNSDCDTKGCYSVWGKQERCNNCISLRALRGKTRYNKLEYSSEGLFFVISQYVEAEGRELVIEMVSKLDDVYVDNIFEQNLLFTKLDELNHQLESDELTGVYNRRHINKYLDNFIRHSLRNHSNLGLAMIDIDGLKSVNDTHGHLMGDRVIKLIAKLLQSNFAMSKGDFVARYGGDEFLVVCCNIDADVFKKRIAEVIRIIRAESLEENQQIEFGISAGCVSLLEFPDFTSDQLIKRADKRLYRAKESGKNCVIAED
ncbi:MAG: EAL domain-containing protein [Hespellia sp.]|nr:EAL domain-containing protein [Hespellia sp.]